MSRTLDLTAGAWRKSSYSEGGDGNCAVVPVRDSKTPHGPVLRFPATAWTAFLSALKGSGRSTA